MNSTLALPALISLAAIWVFVVWLYRDYRVDLFREHLFAIRDDLFDLARSGAISFDNPAYGTLRTMLNGFIRFGDRVCVPWALALTVAIDEKTMAADAPVREEIESRWDEGLKAVDPATREKMLMLRERLHHEFAKQVLFASPLILSASIVLIVPFAAILILTEQVKRFVMRWWQLPADTAAYAEGCIA